MAIKLHDSFAVHPGAWLRAEIVEPAGFSVTALAERLHVTRQAASNLLNGNAGLSAEMAIRFEKAFGLRAATLMRMQAAYALAEARTREDEIEVEAA
ncbi:MAG: antitoxin HigA [Sphingomonadales bacterium]|jgi:addiction module HigA family antidote|nr:antitoxin HigA [Sphingomonadales bacterium]